MNMFQQSFETIRTFEYATIEKITDFSKDKGFGFSDRTLRSMQSGGTLTPNINAMNGVAKYYNVSKSFLLDGKPQNDELYGFIEEDSGGITAYMVEPVLASLVDYLCHFEPAIEDDEEWECYDERGYDLNNHVSLDESMEQEGNTYPQHKITFNGVVVGLSLCEEKAKWIEERLVRAAKHRLNNVSKHALKHLAKLN